MTAPPFLRASAGARARRPELANRQVDLVIQEGEALLTARYTSLNGNLGIETGRRSTGDPKTFSAANMCFSAADALEDGSCLHSVSVDAGGTVIRNETGITRRWRHVTLLIAHGCTIRRNHDPRASFPSSICNMILSLLDTVQCGADRI